MLGEWNDVIDSQLPISPSPPPGRIVSAADCGFIVATMPRHYWVAGSAGVDFFPGAGTDSEVVFDVAAGFGSEIVFGAGAVPSSESAGPR